MKVNSLIFSPTGGCEKVSGILMEDFASQGDKIDLSSQDFNGFTAKEDEVYLISAPVFGGRIPGPAIENLKKIKGNSAKALVVACYGNRHYDDGLIELYDVCKEIGFKVIGGIAALTEHSLWRQYGANRPDEEDKEELKSFIEKIEALVKSEEETSTEIPGSRPYKEASRSTIRPVSNNKCIECMKCVKSCPVKAIPADNPRLTDDDLCFACMRCVAVCPVQARTLGQEVLDLGEKMKDLFAERRKNELFI